MTNPYQSYDPQQAPAAVLPETSEYSRFSIGAILALIGSVLVLISYPMTWLQVIGHSEITISGLGQVNDPRVSFESSKLHWAAGAGAIALIIVAITRLLGKYSPPWRRATIVAPIFGLLGAAASLLSIDKDFEAANGLYLTVVGMVIAAIGAAMIAFLKR